MTNASPDWAELRRKAEEIVRGQAYPSAIRPATILALLDERAALLARAEKAEAEAKALREALRPFAAIADEYDDREDGNLDVMVDFSEHFGKLRLSAFRRARALTGGGHG